MLSVSVFVPLSFSPPTHLHLSYVFVFLPHHAWSQEYGVTRLGRINGHLNQVMFVRIAAAALALDARNLDLFQKQVFCFSVHPRGYWWREAESWAGMLLGGRPCCCFAKKECFLSCCGSRPAVPSKRKSETGFSKPNAAASVTCPKTKYQYKITKATIEYTDLSYQSCGRKHTDLHFYCLLRNLSPRVLGCSNFSSGCCTHRL